MRWTKNWGIWLNESKSIHINFTNRKKHYKPIIREVVPIELYAKYLGTYLDRKLTWRTHISEREKKGDKNQADRNVLVIGRKKVRYRWITNLYFIMKWSYGCQLWRCAKLSNIKSIQRTRNNFLRIKPVPGGTKETQLFIVIFMFHGVACDRINGQNTSAKIIRTYKYGNKYLQET